MLSRRNLEKIVDIQLGYLKDRLKGRHVELEFTENARKQIIDEGFDPAYGARPLKRTIQQKIENRLATELLAGKFEDGDKIRVDANQHRFVFEKV
jgi:ATP-dependent Clp protease ATP-binding subunit ClpB